MPPPTAAEPVLKADSKDATTSGCDDADIQQTTTREFSIAEAAIYRVYRRRWVGLATLMLMNIMISWGWITFAPVSTSTQVFFRLEKASSVNWLSTVIFLAYICMSPVVIYTLRHLGVRTALLFAAGFSITGVWLRFIGARVSSSHGGHFPVVMVGQILIGFGQPFVLSAPAYYSDLWFTSKQRITANALISLSNPLGAALGQLIDPFLVSRPGDIPSMLLYIAIITTAVTAPVFFVQGKPPTPPCPSSAQEKLPFRSAFPKILQSVEFWLIFIMFSVLVGFFNASSSLLNQILEPYGYSENEAGIGGAVLIVVGLLASAVVSPIIDRTHTFLLAIRILVPIISICYIALIFAPTSRSLAPPYIVLAFLGAASFSLLPLSLEFVVEITHPVSPEITSTILWSGGQLLGAAFILSMTALTDNETGGMRRALVFQAIISCFAAIAALAIGWGKREVHVLARRIALDTSEGM
ncbi:hypothetical protein TWF225_011954 [Orbilia oligospora]|uniref:Uncharacterized protein n=2 Tax=Orbilia oligospora TaxID=2813651 RepID=A0A7C8KFJ3_ORBOL|nr:hypothetical protein TWF751_011967 [Orbilia oligospora]KAF3167572.1 hypothetical protein TWF225_011954 [Orbilia oligospora]KAF3236884.1 hypothetical protein TWF128_001276 [Orbilia oligospora]KAF3240685.1 hypothetical protein TWF217_000750 [Orbilia oligospora]KAF3285811.1 hypothetical protein TWF132_009040 [Orbilia oligospora]